MKCRQWKRIQKELDSGSGISPRVQAHLDTCPDCRQRLNAYKHFIRLFRSEAEEPQLLNREVQVRRGSTRRLRLIAAAALISVCAAVSVTLLAARTYNDTVLRKEYAEDISREIIHGSLFSEVNGYLPVYEGTWFESDTAFELSTGRE